MFTAAPLAHDGPDGSNAGRGCRRWGLPLLLRRLTPNGAGAPDVLSDYVAAARGSFGSVRQHGYRPKGPRDMTLGSWLQPVLALIAMCSAGQVGIQSQGPTLAIRHVTIIDGTGAPPKVDMTIVVAGGRILSIGRSNTVQVPAGSQILEGAGKYLIPGLRDMHVHLGGYDEGRKTLQQLLASGITGVRDMASPVDEILRLKTETRDMIFPGPRMVIAGPILQSPLPFALPPMVRTVADQIEARRTVDDLKARGVDFIKVGDTLSRDAYLAIADESKRQRIPFSGHLPVSVSAAEASDVGQRSIEHFGSARFHGVLIACSSQETELSRIVRDALATAMNGGPSPDATVFRAEFTTRLANTYSASRAATLFSRFARNGTWQVPTLVAIRDVWNGIRNELNQQDMQAGDRVWERYVEMIGSMRKAGVKFLAGSDLPIREGVAPIHDELVLLVKAGMSPMEALQAATRNPAEFLGTLATEGTIEVRQTADLLLLEASPLEDIANTRRISAVVLSGRLVGGSLQQPR